MWWWSCWISGEKMSNLAIPDGHTLGFSISLPLSHFILLSIRRLVPLFCLCGRSSRSFYSSTARVVPMVSPSSYPYPSLVLCLSLALSPDLWLHFFQDARTLQALCSFWCLLCGCNEGLLCTLLCLSLTAGMKLPVF